jgi:hypothetical protein
MISLNKKEVMISKATRMYRPNNVQVISFVISIVMATIGLSCSQSYDLEGSDFDNMDSEEVELSANSIKQVEWSNGSVYTYDYTEEYSERDAQGNEKFYTVYRTHRPQEEDVTCDSKECKWCGKEMMAQSITIEEYPDATDYVGLLLIDAMGGRNSYIDVENSKIRSEWRISCNYGINGFCSLKCENEYRYR